MQTDTLLSYIASTERFSNVSCDFFFTFRYLNLQLSQLYDIYLYICFRKQAKVIKGQEINCSSANPSEWNMATNYA